MNYNQITEQHFYGEEYNEIKITRDTKRVESTKGAKKQLRELQLQELRGHTNSGEADTARGCNNITF